MAVEKCPTSLNLSKIWPRYGQNKLKYIFGRYWNFDDFVVKCKQKLVGSGGGDGDGGVDGCVGGGCVAVGGVGGEDGGVGGDGVGDGRCSDSGAGPITATNLTVS